MKRELIVNGVAVSEGTAEPRQWQDDKPAARPRIFDHMSDEPEAERFRQVARAMRKDRRWANVSTRDEPPGISGEFEAKP